ncbi:hypothetical protein KAR91_37300 [Candidatus Pacearchaeota archaeon]|nr:hypothetical protein [Candidatus Pacearchaeota archaeon]
MEGDRRQESMRKVPAVERAMKQMFYPLRGKIVENGVMLKDSDANDAKQTVLSIKLYDELFSVIHNVPLAPSAKTNKDNGEACTPETGDNVLVFFVGGDFSDPIVTSFLPAADNTIQADAAEAPRSYRKFRDTTEKIDKDGNRFVHVAAGDTLNVVGDGAVTIGGALSVTVTGDTTLTVEGALTANVTGNASLTTEGNLSADVTGTADIVAEGKATVQGNQVDIIGADGALVKGIITEESVCPYTGSGHVNPSTTVKCTM